MKKVDKVYRIRIYPDEEQQEIIKHTLDATRWVYNRCLAVREIAYKYGLKYPTYNHLSSLLPKWKAGAYPWLSDADSMALQQAIRDLDRAYENFFDKGRKQTSGHPKFRSKKNHHKTYRTCNNKDRTAIQILDRHHIKLPCLKTTKARVSQRVSGDITSATIEETPSGKYFATLTCREVPVAKLPETDTSVGIDVGIKTHIATSDGTNIPNHRYTKKYAKKLAREQRKLSRKKRGSHNYEKQRLRVARVHEKIANSRRDNTQKVTTALVSENQVISVETLRVKNMVKNPRLAKAIEDASWGELVRELEYKASWYGRDFVQVDALFPSTKTCHVCGHKQNMPLSHRTYRCPHCGMVCDRDTNAAINILHEGMKILHIDDTVGHTGATCQGGYACGDAHKACA